MISKKYKLPIQNLARKPSRTVRSPHFVLKIFFAGLSYSRFGIIISKKIVKLATERNRLKRLVFNLISNNFFSLPVADYLLVINQKPNKKQLVEEFYKIFNIKS